MNSIKEITVKDRKGNAVPLNGYVGEVALVVNTATKTEYTTQQYKELNALYEKEKLLSSKFRCIVGTVAPATDSS